MKSKWFITLVFSVIFCSQVNGGWIIKEVTGNLEHGDQEYQNYYIQNNWFKIVETSSVTLFDLDNEEMSILLPEKESYWTGTVTEFWKETQDALKQQMEEALKELPPNQREVYKSMMEEMGNFTGQNVLEDHKKVSVNETSEKVTIADQLSQKYEVNVGGEVIEYVWISKSVNIQEEVDLEKFGHFMKTMSGPGGEWSFETSEEYISLLKQGYPMRSVEMNEWGGSNLTEVTEVTKQNIPQSEFQIPKDYMRIPLLELMKYQMMTEEEEGDYYNEDEGYEYRN